MADVEQMKKIVPFITCENSFDQYACNLVFGVNVPDLNLVVQVNSVKQAIKSNFVGSRHMSHRGTSAFYYHFNHGFIVLKHAQHSIGLRNFLPFRRHIVNVKQIRTVVRGWSFGLILGVHARRGVKQQDPLCNKNFWFLLD